MSNAHKYTAEGGAIAVVARQHAGVVAVDVHDNGIGLTDDDLTSLFTKFFRARNRVAQEAGGTGLGLAITRAIVERHGGSIAVTSAPGAGSTFTVTLPAVSTP